MTGLRFPWDLPPNSPPKPAPPNPKPRGRRPASARPNPAQPWRYHHLTITGPADRLAAFAQAARGPGITPWPRDDDALEEDVFNLAISQPAARRSLTVEGCRILARQFRDRVEARRARMDGLASPAPACPFDLHALLPVPATILQLGPDHPAARAWIATHWGLADRPRRVTLAPPSKPGPPPVGHGAVAYGFFTPSHDTPHIMVTRLAALCPALRFTLREHGG